MNDSNGNNENVTIKPGCPPPMDKPLQGQSQRMPPPPENYLTTVLLFKPHSFINNNGGSRGLWGFNNRMFWLVIMKITTDLPFRGALTPPPPRLEIPGSAPEQCMYYIKADSLHTVLLLFPVTSRRVHPLPSRLPWCP